MSTETQMDARAQIDDQRDAEEDSRLLVDRCPTHGTPLVWQESWGAPGYVCPECMSGNGEDEE